MVDFLRTITWRERIRRLFLYGGLSPEHYHMVLSEVDARNIRMTRMASVLTILDGYISLLIGSVTQNSTTGNLDFMLGTLGWLIYALTYALPKKHGCSLFLSYSILVLDLGFSLALSSLPSHTGLPATSYVVLVTVLPVIVTDVLWRMILVTGGYSTLFLVISSHVKPAEIFAYDQTNVPLFTVFGLLLYEIVSCSMMQEIYQKFRVAGMQENIIMGMAGAIEDRDANTGGHIHRTADLVRRIVEAMQKNAYYAPLMNEQYSSDIIRSAPLHDIGKIRIPDSVLNKPGRLTPEEFEVMKKHSQYGADMIERIIQKVEDPDYYLVAHNIALYHHERYDGKGYPTGLAGEKIPLESRVMALADVYDALRSKRVYKPRMSKETAVRIMKEGRGTQFDPRLDDLFLEVIRDHDGYEEEDDKV